MAAESQCMITDVSAETRALALTNAATTQYNQFFMNWPLVYEFRSSFKLKDERTVQCSEIPLTTSEKSRLTEKILLIF